jgi:hypothetical protein
LSSIRDSLFSGSKLISNMVPLNFTPSPVKGLASRSWSSMATWLSCGWGMGNFCVNFSREDSHLQSPMCLTPSFSGQMGDNLFPVEEVCGSASLDTSSDS